MKENLKLKVNMGCLSKNRAQDYRKPRNIWRKEATGNRAWIFFDQSSV